MISPYSPSVLRWNSCLRRDREECELFSKTNVLRKVKNKHEGEKNVGSIDQISSNVGTLGVYPGNHYVHTSLKQLRLCFILMCSHILTKSLQIWGGVRVSLGWALLISKFSVMGKIRNVSLISLGSSRVIIHSEVSWLRGWMWRSKSHQLHWQSHLSRCAVVLSKKMLPRSPFHSTSIFFPLKRFPKISSGKLTDDM